ncbi:hypothetical protein GGF40_000332 [Coemansia sp. RSA 1286]|nr:hypothetical protein IWW45_003995 [Coemansia sp. RSA 485]KAJ2640184.1 hypothetical protein GGF40_000332 [Coemansia sp. RSA 1286]
MSGAQNIQLIDIPSIPDPEETHTTNLSDEPVHRSRPNSRAGSPNSSLGIPSYYRIDRSTGLSQRRPTASSANASLTSSLSIGYPSYYNTSIANNNANLARNTDQSAESSQQMPSMSSATLRRVPGSSSSSSSAEPNNIPSYYRNTSPATGMVPGGFPMPQNFQSDTSSTIPSVHSSGYYRVPGADSRTGTVAMPYYNPAFINNHLPYFSHAHINNSAPVAQFPMPMVFHSPFVRPAMHHSQPAMFGYPPMFSAVPMPSPHIPTGLAASAATNSASGSVVHSVTVPSGSANPSQAGGSGEATTDGTATEKDPAEEKNTESADKEAKPKTPEEEKFKDRRALKMRIIEGLTDGSVIMDVDAPHLAGIAQRAGAKAILIIEDSKGKLKTKYIAAQAVVPRFAQKFIDAVAIPSIAMIRYGNSREAKALEKVGIDMIDESSRLDSYIKTMLFDKKAFVTPFVSGAKDLTQALQLISEGAAVIRTDDNYGSGDCRKTLQSLFQMREQLEELVGMTDEEVDKYIEISEINRELVLKTKKLGRLPVPYFAAGGISTPTDVAQARLIGCDGIFTELSIFKGVDPEARAAAMVSACKNFKNPKLIAELSRHFQLEPK